MCQHISKKLVSKVQDDFKKFFQKQKQHFRAVFVFGNFKSQATNPK